MRLLKASRQGGHNAHTTILSIIEKLCEADIIIN